ncbi:YihY/virulence factor BrkB family protein [Leuconostoc fallax]|uniref:YihY/virulence factor BrkB family protein n=1 Tax=Leuconostoc fallax TaxID=1251 RepID=UPI002090A212|nr:YihY/virulence factor BrkB family protein [Leuconostoc fallax]MCO6183307.1 YihY/virulence factor BrkB family protein [Leuconostoc fallax]
MLKKILQFWYRANERYKFDQLKVYWQRSQISYVGPTFAYYVLLTAFPILIGVAMMLSFTNIDNTVLIDNLRNILPPNISKILLPILASILNNRSVSLFSITIILAIWSISRVIAIFRKAFNAIAGVEEKISSLLTRAFSFIWLLVIILLFGVFLIVGNVSVVVLQNFPAWSFADTILAQSQWIVSLGSWLMLVLLNFLLPTKEARTKLRYVLVGSFIEVGLLTLLNKGFTFYAKFALGRYDFYQSISSIIVVLIWLNLIASILVAGYVIIHWLSEFHWREKDV